MDKQLKLSTGLWILAASLALEAIIIRAADVIPLGGYVKYSVCSFAAIGLPTFCVCHWVVNRTLGTSI